MKQSKIYENALVDSFKKSFLLMLISSVAIYLSYSALPLEQEHLMPGMNATILGSNRDLLVASLPWFIGGFVLSSFLFVFSQYRLKRYSRELKKAFKTI